MRRILGAALLATAALATAPAAQATCYVGPLDTCMLPANVLRAVECAVELQPPCIYY
ncbi:MAG TPA: hypothetical protein VNQ77_02690 [Frankiaceae bacterium]|nr:hypothetical protein [Frankiaceae bacterium]